MVTITDSEERYMGALTPEVKSLLDSSYFLVKLVLGGHSVNQLLLVSTYSLIVLRVMFF